jgi:hypothetical protein
LSGKKLRENQERHKNNRLSTLNGKERKGRQEEVNRQGELRAKNWKQPELLGPGISWGWLRKCLEKETVSREEDSSLLMGLLLYKKVTSFTKGTPRKWQSCGFLIPLN